MEFKHTGTYLRGNIYSWGRGSGCKINYFFLSTLLHHGGSVTSAIPRYLSSIRYGGGRVDSLNYLSMYNKSAFYTKKVDFNLRIKAQLALNGLSRSLFSPTPLGELRTTLKINAQANPGPSFLTAGATSKLDSLDLAWECAYLYLSNMDKEGRVKKPLFSLAGRAKLMTKVKLVDKLFDHAPLGRAVWMADAHENILCSCFTIVMMEWFKRTQHRIMLGFNKFSNDVKKLTNRLEKFDVYLQLDVSKLDSSLRIDLIKRAFALVGQSFGANLKGRWKQLLANIQEWYINTPIVLPNGEIKEKTGGGPSGSGFISIINSLCMSIAVGDCLYAMYGPISKGTYDFVVYGDNCIVGIQHRYRSEDAAKRWGRCQMLHLAQKAKAKFGLDFNPLESKVCIYLYVRYGVPILPPGLEIKDFSSDKLREFHASESRRLGRPLRPSERIKIIDKEPAGPAPGRTHRWTYVFADTVSWLSYYFKNDGCMIRPHFEIEERLMNPERPPATVEDYEVMLINCLVENYGNHHTRNRIMHWYYDAYMLKQSGVHCLYQARAECEALDFRSAIPKDRETLPWRVTKGGRAWYRRQKDIVDLTSEPCMAEFNSRWEEIICLAGRVFYGNQPFHFNMTSLTRARGKLLRGIPRYAFQRKFVGYRKMKQQFHFLSELYGDKVYLNAIQGNLIHSSDEDIKQKAKDIVFGKYVNRGPISVGIKTIPSR